MENFPKHDKPTKMSCHALLAMTTVTVMLLGTRDGGEATSAMLRIPKFSSCDARTLFNTLLQRCTFTSRSRRESEIKITPQSSVDTDTRPLSSETSAKVISGVIANFQDGWKHLHIVVSCFLMQDTSVTRQSSSSFECVMQSVAVLQTCLRCGMDS